MAKDKDTDKDKTKDKEGVREDQLLSNIDKKKEELEELDAKQDVKDDKGDPEARLKDAGKDGEREGMYKMKEDELKRHLSHLYNSSENHEGRIAKLETGGGATNPPVAPQGFNASDMVGLVDSMIRSHLTTRDIKRDFAKNFPDEKIEDVSRKLKSDGLDFDNPRHAAFIEQLSLQAEPGKLYKRLSERPDVLSAVTDMHPAFHGSALEELKSELKGKIKKDISDSPEPTKDDSDDSKRKSRDESPEDKLVSKFYERKRR